MFTMDEEVCHPDQPGVYPKVPQLEQTVPPLSSSDLFVKFADDTVPVARQNLSTGRFECLERTAGEICFVSYYLS